jgi:hypothetical protein
MKEGTAQIGLENDWSPDAAGWVRLARYGEHPKTRTVERPGGGVQRETWIQVLDKPAATQMANQFNGLVGRLRRAIRSVPVYVGHPDLATVSPETAAAIGDMTPVGATNRLQARDDGLYAQLSLFPSGQAAVENDGLKKLSPLWWVEPIGAAAAVGQPIRCRPHTLISIALTDQPNLAGGEALANQTRTPEGVTPSAGSGARSASYGDSSEDLTHMKHLLIGLLAAQGVVLANDATDDTVFARINERLTKLNGDLTALGNEKATLTSRVAGLEADLTAEKAARTKADGDLAAARTALGNERKARATALVDLAIHKGQLPIADRDVRITALFTAADFDAAATALGNEKARFNTGSGSASGERRSDANASPAAASTQLMALANELVQTGKAPDWNAAWQLTKTTHAGLHEQLAAKADASK